MALQNGIIIKKPKICARPHHIHGSEYITILIWSGRQHLLVKYRMIHICIDNTQC